MQNLIHVFFLVFLLTTSVYAQSSGSSNEAYSSNIEDYPSDWKGRDLFCIGFGEHLHWIPGFTLGWYSNPSNKELGELCECIDKNNKRQWVRDTGRKFNHNEDVSWLYKQAFASAFGEKIKLCTKNK